MTKKNSRPKFLTSFFAALSDNAERGWRSLVPIWMIICGAIGWLSVCYIPASFWGGAHEDGVVALYIGILVLDGLILALSWSAFSRIFESISDGEFGAYLMKHDLLGGYIFYVEFLNVAQIASLIATSVAIFSFITEALSVAWDRGLCAVMVAVSAYAIRAACAAITVMNDLLWQKGMFDAHVRAQESKIVPLRKEGNL